MPTRTIDLVLLRFWIARRRLLHGRRLWRDPLPWSATILSNHARLENFLLSDRLVRHGPRRSVTVARWRALGLGEEEGDGDVAQKRRKHPPATTRKARFHVFFVFDHGVMIQTHCHGR